MGLFEIFMIGVGLSMDAFAASICKGLNMRRLSAKNMLIIGLFFGGFQALMPAVGWILGKQFEVYITSVDHWVAFALLAFIGGKMIYDVFHGDEDGCCNEKTDKLDMKEVLTLAVATSIDALAVGISFAFLQVEILKAVSVIGVTTFVLSAVGVAVGNMFGAKYEKNATLAGGIILILIGLKILLEHTGIIG
ncbi:MAG: manganese efflux pump MntP family protein [Firmicutes bacterium]|nr:manganese efflux pump MntP family protein [Bacillota bacterium]